jgi:uncharacterized cupredoxin-like copper-binding protein
MINLPSTKPIILSAFILTAVSLGSAPSYAAGSHGAVHGAPSGKMEPMKGGHMDGKGRHGHSLDFGEAGKALEVSRTIEVIMQENYYTPENIDVKAGETIRFKVTNKGELVHEFNLGTANMHAAHQKEMEVMVEHGVLEADKINHNMMKRDMGGGKTMEHNDPNSILLEPGTSGEVIWKFTKTTELEFACNVPGHYESGMMGQMRVR